MDDDDVVPDDNSLTPSFPPLNFFAVFRERIDTLGSYVNRMFLAPRLFLNPPDREESSKLLLLSLLFSPDSFVSLFSFLKRRAMAGEKKSSFSTASSPFIILLLLFPAALILKIKSSPYKAMNVFSSCFLTPLILALISFRALPPFPLFS